MFSDSFEVILERQSLALNGPLSKTHPLRLIAVSYLTAAGFNFSDRQDEPNGIDSIIIINLK